MAFRYSQWPPPFPSTSLGTTGIARSFLSSCPSLQEGGLWGTECCEQSWYWAGGVGASVSVAHLGVRCRSCFSQVEEGSVLFMEKATSPPFGLPMPAGCLGSSAPWGVAEPASGCPEVVTSSIVLRWQTQALVAGKAVHCCVLFLAISAL